MVENATHPCGVHASLRPSCFVEETGNQPPSPARMPRASHCYNGCMTTSPFLSSLVEGLILTGQIEQDVPLLLSQHILPGTARHCAEVAAEAVRLAGRFGVDPGAARTAGWLHDVSAVIGTDWLQAAEELGVEILPAELIYPNLLHHKISTVLAREIFGVTNPAILAAIGCHTTLRPGASRLDMAVFVADKLAWDQPGQPPYEAEMQAALEQSLEQGAWVYLNYLWERREDLVVLHPWAEAAWREIK
jgi:predicted HD superfamily hydrolase involved in NAD metabolism